MAYPVVPEESLPSMAVVRQSFESSAPVDVEKVIEDELARAPIKSGETIAVTAGSRGIVDIARTVKAVVEHLKRRGAKPFIMPAMGSHGGATPEGQTEVLETYGITEASHGVPIRASMETVVIGQTASGMPVHCSRVAREADGVVLVNRIKPHTDYGGPLGSGLLKMMAIGLGKQNGANQIHRLGARVGMENALYDPARFILANTNIRAGVALIEDAHHKLSHVEVVPTDSLEARERQLLQLARARMPQLPFDEIDFLIVDRIGKDISGTGMDPNVIGRGGHGYSSRLFDMPDYRPIVRRIFVRDLSEGTHGNALGIGIADFTTDRVRREALDDSTLANSLTALAVQVSKMPMAFADDRLAIGAAVATLALDDPRTARVVRIRDTLALETLEVSLACLQENTSGDKLQVVTQARPMKFDGNGNLLAIGAA